MWAASLSRAAWARSRAARQAASGIFFDVPRLSSTRILIEVGLERRPPCRCRLSRPPRSPRRRLGPARNTRARPRRRHGLLGAKGEGLRLVVAQREDGRDPVGRVRAKLPHQVVAGVVLRTGLQAQDGREMPVRVHDARHQRLAPHVDAGGAVRRLHVCRGADLGDDAVPHHDRASLDDLPGAIDDAPVDERRHLSGRGEGRRGGAR